MWVREGLRDVSREGLGDDDDEVWYVFIAEIEIFVFDVFDVFDEDDEDCWRVLVAEVICHLT